MIVFLQDRPRDDVLPLSSTLEILEARLGLARADAFVVLVNRWKELLGNDLADVCELVSLRDGVMHMKARDPAVADALKWMTADLVAASNDICGGPFVSDVKLTVRHP